MALSGCGADPQTAAGPGASTPARGGTLRLAYDNDPKCIDGQQNGTNNALNISRQMTDSLTDQDPKTGAIKPWLATSWTVGEDARTYTFKLRHGVKFHDGTPFTAQSVKQNFSGIAALGAKAQLASTYLAGLKSISTPDAHTVRIAFKEPNAQFLQATSTMSLGFYAPATWKLTPEQRCTGGLVGTGPFELDGYTPGSGARLTRFADYAWPSSLPRHRGPAYLAALDFQNVAEASVRTGSLSSGDIDVDQSVQPQNEELLQASNFQLAARPNPGVVYSFYVNTASPIFADARVRRALGQGIDRPELRALLSREQSEATSALAASTPGYRNRAGTLSYDPAGAKRLLDQAGWHLRAGSDIRVKDGRPLRVELPYWQNAPFLELIAQQLRGIGIELELKRVTSTQQTALKQAGELDLLFANLTRADPDILRSVYAVDAQNQTGKHRDGIDELFDRSTATVDPAERYALLGRAGDELVKGGFAVPLVELSTVMALAPQVRGFHYEASSRFQLYDTWLAGRAGEGE
ncbi:ABC transporter substrate-binding protein [Brevibacterium sp. 91QC2O2]|uniref:ABC transporter substrate-binding protein n=1 Tax=Brevibacterium TaxID=1696 RepID=UPI00211B8A34|nr:MULTISPECIES: ABC transporter substrate-binding protein [unclassified Brevibacterium]MCQ9367828.1 ABC transporter substrate-binding protein [Brevibacterium sp. 91QC2O2]MCQ9384867.1 ABC transporter substrate-binding protein [Brevibacterium sp. 68QC2CO]